MIFGKKKQKPSVEEINKKQVNYFAWRPFRLHDGRWIWLQLFWREWWSSWGCGGYDYYANKKDTEIPTA